MNILILGSKGFLGEALKKYFIFKNFFVLGLDKKGNSNRNNLKANINKFDIKKIVKHNNINLIIDAIGYSGHNLQKRKFLTRSLRENLEDKSKLINDLSKINTKILYVSFGTLYKYGNKNKIKKQYFGLTNNSKEAQTQIKFKYEEKLIRIKNKNLRILTINVGSVYGNRKKLKKLDKNIIDIILQNIKNKIKMDLYLTNNRRVKNIIDINSLSNEVYKIITYNYEVQKRKYKEVNIDKYLFDLVKLKKFKNLNFVNSENKDNLNYYYVGKPKNIGFKKFINSIQYK
jgi:nucleoside-diphosphate-sugar epimerase